MRLKINLSKKNCVLPLNYQHLLQGVIYNAMIRSDIGAFYHDEGYQWENKKFKMFVFSKLFGENSIDIKNKKITYEENMYFYLSSEDERFLQYMYQYFNTNRKMVLYNQIVDVGNLELTDLSYFSGIKELTIRSFSPVTVYSTNENGFVHYLKPSDENYENMVIQNLQNKDHSIDVEKTLYFKIKEVLLEKKRIMSYKNTTYEAYDTTLKIETNYHTLHLMYNSGMGSKGSCGFGMIEIKNEKNIVSI